MASSSRSTGAAAVWVTVVVLIGLAVAAYFLWPQAMAYWTNMNVNRIIKGKAISCYKLGSVDACIPPIVSDVQAETGVQLNSTNLDIEVEGKRVKVRCKYKLKLEYPFTGNLLGSNKERFKRYDWIVDMESKYIM